jgi:predicted  nucleic acid-binding Zn-ribbon protein
MSVAAQLFDLQVVDLELDGLKAHLAATEAAIGETEAIVAKRAATAEAERKLAAAQAALLDKELELKLHEEHLAATQGKLYGGSVHNPKELVGLQQESASLARQKDHLESAALELMEQADAARAAMRSAQDEQAHAQAQWAADQVKLRAEIASLTERSAAVSAQRNALAAQLGPKTLATYDRLRLEKAGRAVVKLEHASCMGCGVTMSSGEAQHARSLAMYGLAYCSNCGRILFAGR